VPQRQSLVFVLVLTSLALAILLALVIPVRQPKCVGWTGYLPLVHPSSPGVTDFNETASYICG
jgi:heme/copper-type cytochrome/quinol oxidase subunit 1